MQRLTYSVSQFVLKVHSRCDLACNHCYIYESADQSWRGRPRIMDARTIRAAAARIAEHATTHRIPTVHIVLHGGEPLLMGVDAMRACLVELRAAIEGVASVDLRLQSNGLQLSEAYCDLLLEHEVKVGISLDGGRAANDRHRVFANGASSYTEARRALALLRRPRYRPIYAGILCTVDVRNDPLRVYDALRAELPPVIDFLLPHATWDTPPLRPDGQATPYAVWLGRIYDRWLREGRPVPIRLFDSLLSAGSGGPSATESVGLDPVGMIVIETDGSYEQADSLKVTYDGAAATGLDVFGHRVDDAAGHPGVRARQGGLADLASTCVTCEVVTQCGGGMYAHRYSRGSGFANPSVYCADLKELITGMNAAAPTAPSTDHLPAGLLDQLAGGAGDEATIDYLVASQIEIRRILLRAVVEIAGASTAASRIADAQTLLVRLERDAPQAVQAVLRHPFLRVWAADCIAGRRPERSDPAFVACIAAAAAIRARVDAEILVPVDGAQVFLPTVGRVGWPQMAGGQAVVRSSAAGASISYGGQARDLTGPGRPEWGFQPSRYATVDATSFVIEDLDPHRDCRGWPVTPRLTDVEADEWARAVTAAWTFVDRDTPAHLPGIRRALAALTPLVADPAGALRSRTARDAFGAIGAARPASVPALAVMLVHELQHCKLGALLDLVDLCDPTDPTRIGVAWRPDPRPVQGAMQGAYAHLAVAQIWQARAAHDGPDRKMAADHAAMYRRWTEQAIDALLATAALTAEGVRFVTGMGATIGAAAA